MTLKKRRKREGQKKPQRSTCNWMCPATRRVHSILHNSFPRIYHIPRLHACERLQICKQHSIGVSQKLLQLLLIQRRVVQRVRHECCVGMVGDRYAERAGLMSLYAGCLLPYVSYNTTTLSLFVDVNCISSLSNASLIAC